MKKKPSRRFSHTQRARQMAKEYLQRRAILTPSPLPSPPLSTSPPTPPASLVAAGSLLNSLLQKDVNPNPYGSQGWESWRSATTVIDLLIRFHLGMTDTPKKTLKT